MTEDYKVPRNKRWAEERAKGKPVFKYMGDGSQKWGYAPPRDLTEADLQYIEQIQGGSRADILELARFPTGEPLYMRIKEYEKLIKAQEEDKGQKEATYGNDTD